MSDLVRNVLAVIGGLVVAAWVIGAALIGWQRWLNWRASRTPLPELELPQIPYPAYVELHESFAAWERGEKP